MKLLKTLAGIAAVLLLALAAVPLPASGLMLAYAPITITDVDKLWRKAQGPLAEGFNFATPEFKWISRFRQFKELPSSLREMTWPVDLNEDTNVASPTEGGRAAVPTTVNAVDATIAFVHKNKRFTISKLADWAGSADGARAYIMDQIKWEGKKAVEAMARNLGDEFYGYSTGTLAVVSGDPGSGATSHTITLKNAYGSSLIAGSTDAQKRYLTNLFKVGQKVCLIRSAAVVTNTIASSDAGEVTAVDPAAGTIDVTWPGSVDPAADDLIVNAAGANPSTIDHTSYQRHLIGLLEMYLATSLHGIDGSSVDNWNASVNDQDADRFDGITWRNSYDQIRNYGREDAKVKTLMDQGVYRDWLLSASGGVRFNNPMSMEQDGELKTRGEVPMQSRRVPPGMVFMWDEMAIKRRTIHDTVSKNGPGWDAAKEAIDDEFYLFPLGWVGYLVCMNRKSLAFHANKTRQGT